MSSSFQRSPAPRKSEREAGRALERILTRFYPSGGDPAIARELGLLFGAADRGFSRADAASLRAAEDALSLDNSALTVDESVEVVLGWWAQRRPFG